MLESEYELRTEEYAFSDNLLYLRVNFLKINGDIYIQ